MKKRLMGIAVILAACAGCGGDDTTSPAGGGSVTFTASGEVLALTGYDFPSADVGFVDGWEVRFEELLVTVDKITLSENPDTDPGDESKTGKVVAEVDGPFAIDLHKGGPLAGKGGSDEQAVQIATVENQNKNGGAAFAADTRYAFGFDIIKAAADAKNVNLDAAGLADYEIMKTKGYAVLYVGTATFKGTDCGAPDPVLDALPKVVHFKLGFASPTTYVNCQNPDNDPAKALGSEEHERGVVVKANQAVIAQVTVHTDHPFWESFVHDSPAHFDMVAAQVTGAASPPTATLEDMKGVDPGGITDKTGKPLNWRSCTKDYTPPDMGQMHFDTTGVPVNPTGDPKTDIRDLYDFMTYDQSTQGHLNSDGLCFVKRNYPSPP